MFILDKLYLMFIVDSMILSIPIALGDAPNLRFWLSAYLSGLDCSADNHAWVYMSDLPNHKLS